MAYVLLITNPAAARTTPGKVKAVCAVFAREGWKVDLVDTSRPDDAAALARQGVSNGVDVIAVYGGDGTTAHAVGGMVGHGIPVGLIPGGTGNLLSANLRLPQNPVKAALVVTRGVPRKIDLGRMVRPDGTRYFAVACGAGFDAELMSETPGSSKRRWGMGAYVGRAWETLREVASVPYRITIDEQVLEVEAATVLVANCGEIIPPVLSLRAGISLDDGLFEVVALQANGLLESVGVVWDLLTRRGNGSDRVSYAPGAVVTVESAKPRPVQMDGEPGGVTPFTAELLPGALSVMVPAR